eukprot:1136811-Pelagomonas_calceolata.AAC.9
MEVVLQFPVLQLHLDDLPTAKALLAGLVRKPQEEVLRRGMHVTPPLHGLSYSVFLGCLYIEEPPSFLLKDAGQNAQRGRTKQQCKLEGTLR